MSLYKHILLAADFTLHGKEIAAKAKILADDNQAQLSIIHVVDNLPITDSVYGPIIPFEGDLTAELMQVAKNQLAKISENLNINEQNQWLETGSPKMEIVRIADQVKADLIIVGSHGRHGLALLLGSTANGVLHHALCDVLAIRLQND